MSEPVKGTQEQLVDLLESCATQIEAYLEWFIAEELRQKPDMTPEQARYVALDLTHKHLQRRYNDEARELKSNIEIGQHWQDSDGTAYYAAEGESATIKLADYSKVIKRTARSFETDKKGYTPLTKKRSARTPETTVTACDLGYSC